MRSLELVRAWPVDAAAVGVAATGVGAVGAAPVGGTGRLSTVGVVGLADRPFRWASVTKPVIALAILVAIEEGTLALDTEAGPPGSTVAHLLAHASGLAVDEPRPITTPGTRRIYSNSGYEILGEVLADRSGLPLEEYVTEGVLRPLGMAGTTFGPPSAARSGETGANPPGPAAAGLCGTLTDLLVLAGEWWSPSLISPETRNRAVTTAYAGLAGVLPGFGRFDPCDWGLGVEVKGAKAPHWSGPATSATTFGHFGRSGAFVWIDPDVGVACAGLSDRPFGPWALEAWPRLSEAVLTELAVDRTTPPSSGPDLQV